MSPSANVERNMPNNVLSTSLACRHGRNHGLIKAGEMCSDDRLRSGPEVSAVYINHEALADEAAGVGRH